MKLQAKSGGKSSAVNWRLAAIFAILTVVIVAGLLYNWFALADRYVIFLYNHDMFPSHTDTSAFSRVTSSRYWMAGLVASGVVMVLYTTVNLI
ncbi:MAG: hypothetical protein PVH03_02235 [Chloroflexota bacterium]|jgi:hypothetical protein